MMPASRRQISVLISDDDFAVLEAVVELVSGLGGRGRMFEIHRAHTGSDALKILLSTTIDLSILDIHMPDMTGLEVVRRYLRGPLVAFPRMPALRTPRPSVPTIFMSGEATPEIRAEAGDLGSPLLDKPLVPDDMRAAVNRVLEHLTF